MPEDHSPDHAPCAPPTRDEAIRKTAQDIVDTLSVRTHDPRQLEDNLRHAVVMANKALSEGVMP